MTTIDPRSSVVAALQARLAALRPKAAAAPAPAGAAGTQAQAAGAGAGAAAAVLARRIAALDPSDPDRRRKAVRLFLEGELARTFGAALLNDPSFPDLLDAVQQQMQQDAQAAAAVDALGAWLVAAPA